MKIGDRLVPFVIASMLLHMGATFWYVHAFRGRPIPVPKKETLYKVNLVELPKPKPVVEPERQEREAPQKPKAEEIKKIPEKVRPREEKKKEEAPPRPVVVEEPKEEKVEEVVEPEAPAPAITREKEVEAPQLTSNNPITVEVENFAFSYYLALIENRVGGMWNPPKGLVVSHPSVTVRFEILRNGRISSPEIARSSGQSFFDLSAMRAVQEADPFPPLPDGFDGDRLTVNFIFHYEG